MLSNTAKKALEFYGGEDRWRSHSHIEAEVSVKGLAFILKRRPYFRRAKIRMEIARPVSSILPIGNNNALKGILQGSDVRLEDEAGRMIAERKNARSFFPFGRRLFWWDDLDMAYFANYAFWNYFTFPRLLLNPEIHWEEKEAGLLLAEFPESLPSHSKKQSFRFDTQTGMLLQHNYTAEVISKLATAAHELKEHKVLHGLQVPVTRIVSPMLPRGKALGWPVLIDIRVHDFKLI